MTLRTLDEVQDWVSQRHLDLELYFTRASEICGDEFAVECGYLLDSLEYIYNLCEDENEEAFPELLAYRQKEKQIQQKVDKAVSKRIKDGEEIDEHNEQMRNNNNG